MAWPIDLAALRIGVLDLDIAVGAVLHAAGIAQDRIGVADQIDAVGGGDIERRHPACWLTRMPMVWLSVLSALSRWSSKAEEVSPVAVGGLDLLIERVDLLDQRIGGGNRIHHLAVDLALQRRRWCWTHWKCRLARLLQGIEHAGGAGRRRRRLRRDAEGGRQIGEAGRQRLVVAGTAQKPVQLGEEAGHGVILRGRAAGRQIFLLQELIDHALDAGDIDAHQLAAGRQGLLIDDPAGIARRVDVRDIVRRPRPTRRCWS